MGRQVAEIGKVAEYRLVVGAIVGCDQLRNHGSVGTVFDRVLEWAKRLRPQAVLAPVPEQEGMKRCSGKRHRAPRTVGDTMTDSKIVLKLSVGLVARRARNR